MADMRAISLAPPAAPWQGTEAGILMQLETAEPNFTVGNKYDVLSLVVDCQPTTPKPYAVMFDDDGHLKIVDLGKLRRPPPP